MRIGLKAVACVLSATFCGVILAQSPAPKAAETAGEKPAEKPKPGPKYLNLRFDEDYSYLDEPEKAEKDFFDPIKNIRFGKDWRLSLGGEMRYRFEDRRDFDFNRKRVDHDSFNLTRVRMHADLKFRQFARLFVEGRDSRMGDEKRLTKRGSEDTFDIQNLFLDLKALGGNVPLTLRLGRQELSYGDERLIGSLDWGNVRRTFDGVKAIYDTKPVRVDIFWVRPVGTPRKDLNDADYSRSFRGAYATLKTIPNHALDVYAVQFKEETTSVTGGDGRRGDFEIETYGSRFVGTRKAFNFGAFDYGVEAAMQRGNWSHDDVDTWAIHTRGGYTFQKIPWTPRLGVEYNHASGDHNPRDDKFQTFHNLFPTNHDKYGYMDFVGWRNIDNWRFSLSAQPTPKLFLSLDYHLFHLDEERDALYNAG
ncbi:MAG: hypothetical protein FJ279_24485, partial [Planctomycetes bacterium]|nr:hypothetical protein [Planctomycetota bacterium]